MSNLDSGKDHEDDQMMNFEGIFENDLETDYTGEVSNQEGTFQIKIFRTPGGFSHLIGTITFHKGYDDYFYDGILNENNSGKLIELWRNTGISCFILKHNKDRWFVRPCFHGFHYMGINSYEESFLEQRKGYDEFIEENPDFKPPFDFKF